MQDYHDGLVRLIHREVSRRSLLKGAAAAAGGVALAATFNGSALQAGIAHAQAQPFQNDAEVLNFALTLEFLEADLYNTLLNAGVIKNPTYMRYLTTFRDHEVAHTQLLPPVIRKLGGNPVEPRPKYNYSAFDVSTEQKAMTVLAAVEEVGVGAYQGAAPFLKDTQILTTAVGIHGVEAEHTSAVRQLLGLPITTNSLTSAVGIKTNVLSGAFTQPLPPEAVLAAVKPILG